MPTNDSISTVDYQAIFKTAPSLYVVLKPNSPSYTILAANEAYAKATHTDAEDIVGRSLLEVFPVNPDDPAGDGRKFVLESLEFAVTRRLPHIIPLVRYDVRALHNQGIKYVEKYWLMVTTPVFDSDGEIKYIIHRVEDITEKKRLVEERQRFFDEGADMVMVATFDGYLTRVNSAWEETLGWSIFELTSKPWTAFVHPDDLAATARVGNDLVRGKSIANFENRFLCKDGSYRWLRWNVKPFVNERLIYGGASDVTDYKNIQAELLQTLSRAEAANVAKTEFLSNMSHEIRTPMNAIIGLSNILAMGPGLSPKQREYVATLQSSADSLLCLINDLLDIAKIEAHTVELEQIPFSIVQVVEECISMLNVRAKQKHLTLEVISDCGKDSHILGDPTRLRQIIVNICSNAIKFTEHGTVTVTISCQEIPESHKQMFEIAVKDTGIGIPSEKMSAIFQKFTQADSSINRKYGGTGLGLAITKTLVEIMGGTISVESEVNQGSIFTVRIPCEMSAASLSGETSKGRAHAVLGGKSLPTAERVLLVEDYAPNILVATTFLEQFGYRTDVAESGAEAIAKVKATRYHAVLMDVQMHGTNGLEATQQIRVHEREHSKCPTHIIGMTAHAMSGDRERCISAGMNAYISKPFDPEKLQAMLAAVPKRANEPDAVA